MNENDYYSKYLKYKMKYLREKSIQLGGIELEAQVKIYNMRKELLGELSIVYDNEKTISDIKKTIFEKSVGKYPIEKQIFKYKSIVPKDTDIYKSIYPSVEAKAFFDVFIKV